MNEPRVLAAADPRVAEPAPSAAVASLLCPTDAAPLESSSMRAKLSYCSHDEPKTCECPVAALAPASAVDHGPTGPSVLE